MGEEKKAIIEAGYTEFDRFQGCLLGGAIGDALGYPIEFMKYKDIEKSFGKIETFLDLPLISDDTQMSLFTAVAAISSYARKKGPSFDPMDVKPYAEAYLDWFYGQRGERNPRPYTFLANHPTLHDPRAPGNTCLSALEHYKETGVFATRANPINNSKGCGGVMRVAPIGLFISSLRRLGYDVGAKEAAILSADVAAITHGEPLGYLSAAYLGALIYLLARRKPNERLLWKINECSELIKELFGEEKGYADLEEAVHEAVFLGMEDIPDNESIAVLGEGWVGEEALSIGLYSAIKYQEDFSKAMTCAVTHSGDSDSTGAIAGNILGTYLGVIEIEKSFKDAPGLEHYPLILRTALDLATLGEDKNTLDGFDALYREGKLQQERFNALFPRFK